MTTRTHPVWQSIWNGQKNRPSYGEELLGKRHRVFDMVEDIQADDHIVGLVGDPGRKVGVKESDPGRLGHFLNVQAHSGQGGREIGKNRRLTAADIEDGGRLKAHQQVMGDTVVRTRPIRGIKVRQWH